MSSEINILSARRDLSLSSAALICSLQPVHLESFLFFVDEYMHLGHWSGRCLPRLPPAAPDFPPYIRSCLPEEKGVGIYKPKCRMTTPFLSRFHAYLDLWNHGDGDPP